MHVVSENVAAEVQQIGKRYKNAYQRARVITIVGFVVIFFGAIAMAILPIEHEAHGILRGMDKGFADVLVIFGYVLGLMLMAAGVLVLVLGQILRATLDNAVNSSPFLTNDIRTEVMSLR